MFVDIINVSCLRSVAWRDVKLFEIQSDAFKVLLVLQSVDVVFAHDIGNVRERIIWTIDDGWGTFSTQDRLVTFSTPIMFTVFFTNEIWNDKYYIIIWTSLVEVGTFATLKLVENEFLEFGKQSKAAAAGVPYVLNVHITHRHINTRKTNRAFSTELRGHSPSLTKFSLNSYLAKKPRFCESAVRLSVVKVTSSWCSVE